MRTSLVDLLKVLKQSASGSYFKPNFEDSAVQIFWYGKFGDMDLAVVSSALAKIDGAKEFPTPQELAEQIKADAKYTNPKSKGNGIKEEAPLSERQTAIRSILRHEAVKALHESDQYAISQRINLMESTDIFFALENIDALIHEIFPYLAPGYKRQNLKDFAMSLKTGKDNTHKASHTADVISILTRINKC